MKFYKTAALMLSILSILPSIACSQQDNTPAKPDEHEQSAGKPYTQLILGQDYTDLTADLTILTHRTDLIQDTSADHEFSDYIREFNKLYPHITITYEGVTDYDFDVANRLPSGSWGDICNIPDSTNMANLQDYFEPLGNLSEMQETYEFISAKAVGNTVYGIPSEGNAQGIVYNKKVWQKAGIKTTPKTPDEFIAALQAIKDNTEAIPLYTNFAATWPLVTWDYHIFCSTGDANFRNEVMLTEQTPFSERDNKAGPFEIYRTLYNAVSQHLIEEDPANTSWEKSKEMMNNGEIGAMVLGSWAVSQVQSAGDHPNDISYMPFPLTIDGKQYALSGSDYCYAINKNISEEKKTAAKLYIKFMTEQSGYAYDNSCIPVLKGEDYPPIFKNFENVELVPDIATNADYDKVNQNSGLSIGGDSEHIVKLINDAMNERPLEDIINEWNTAWQKGQTETPEE